MNGKMLCKYSWGYYTAGEYYPYKMELGGYVVYYESGSAYFLYQQDVDMVFYTIQETRLLKIKKFLNG
jgi:hypothetical protein